VVPYRVAERVSAFIAPILGDVDLLLGFELLPPRRLVAELPPRLSLLLVFPILTSGILVAFSPLLPLPFPPLLLLLLVSGLLARGLV